MKNLHPAIAQRGVTLIELLVAMVIGLVIVGTVIGLFVNTSSARRQSVAAAEMNEDGLYALKVLTTHIRLAGYNPLQPNRLPVGLVTWPSSNDLGTSTLGIFGCDKGFSNGLRVSGVLSATQSFQLTCNGGTSTIGAIAVTYEADKYNTVPTSTGVPTDCLGTGLPQLSQPNSNSSQSRPFYVAENRFYVSNNQLYCAGNGGGGTGTFVATQSIVQNVEDLQFSFGAMTVTSTTPTFTPVAGYLTSAEVGNASGIDGTAIAGLNTFTARQRWDSVLTVRICVLMRSVTQVLDKAQPYQGCDLNTTVTVPTDRYLRRAYVTTVNLRNRL